MPRQIKRRQDDTVKSQTLDRGSVVNEEELLGGIQKEKRPLQNKFSGHRRGETPAS